MKEKRIEKAVILKPKGKVIVFILSLLSLFSSIFAIYNLLKLRVMGGKVARYLSIVIAIIVVIYLLIIILTSKKMKKQKKLKRNIKKKGIYTALIMYFLITTIISLGTYYIYNYVGSFNKEYVTYSSSLITLSDTKCNKIEDVDDFTIGVLSDKTSIDGYVIPKEIIKENKLEDENTIVYYDSYQEMMAELYSNELDALFITSNYESIFNTIEVYENIKQDTKVIISKTKKVKKTESSSRESSSVGKSITQPFTILLMGVDSTDEGLDKNTVAHGDTLILITFNPKTLNATMLSIPRDSYVPIACWKDKAENKITHAAVYGNSCMMDTIENYFDVKIDYYAKINFRGLVSLVDAMGGIDVEVPKDLCTDNSNREKEVCISKGFQHLNGEQALVLTRNRKQLAGGDLDRGQNQQLVIQAMLNKIKSIKSAKKFLNILDTISNNFDTNFTTDQILSFYSIAEDIMNNDLGDGDLVNIEQLYLDGSGQSIYDERAKMVLWNYIPNKESRNDIVEAMKTNLGLKKYEEENTFSFSINDEYVKEVIGKGPYKKDYRYTLVPNFIGYTKSTAQSIADKLNINITFVGTSGTVIKQSAIEGQRVDKIKGPITLTLSSNSKEKEITKDSEKSTDIRNSKEKEEKEDKKEKEEKEETEEKETQDKNDQEKINTIEE